MTFLLAGIAGLALGTGFAPGFETITQAEIETGVRSLASPDLEGRDTPSLGLERAAQWIEKAFEESRLAFAPDSAEAWKRFAGEAKEAGTYRRPFQRRLQRPAASGCSLDLEGAESGSGAFALGRDFVPVQGCEGDAAGEVVFAGYGIQSKTEKYDDLAGLKLKGRIALLLEGEPRTTDRRFEGTELSRAASLWEKVEALSEAGALGILAVRRPEGEVQDEISFRSAWALFNGVAPDEPARRPLPVLEITTACATRVLGQDVLELAKKIDKTVRPVKAASAERRVRMRARTEAAEVRADNVIGLVRGGDPALVEEYVVLGAHYDHLGVDPRGRIACGADDNASGVAAMLEIAEALATAGPRRSVLCCAFAGEEAGLLGSQALCADPPVPKDRIVAMVNLDMIGRGDAAEVAALGIVQNPGFERLIARARKLRPTGVREVVVKKGEDLFERSDHYSFHRIGVPVLFFFEGLPIDKNKDYHTWRDTVDKLDFTKMLNTTRLVYNVTWILSEDDERPPPPRG